MAHAQLTIEEIGARSILVPQDGPPATEFTLNPYSGCGMGCAYCYVMKFPHAKEHPLAWGEWVQPKTNVSMSCRNRGRKYSSARSRVARCVASPSSANGTNRGQAAANTLASGAKRRIASW